MIYPFPEQAAADKAETDKLLGKLEAFLKANLNPDEVDLTREIPEKVIKGLFEMGAVETRFSQACGGEIGLVQRRAGECGAVEVRPGEIGVRKIRA